LGVSCPFPVVDILLVFRFEIGRSRSPTPNYPLILQQNFFSMDTVLTQRHIEFDRQGFEDSELLDIYRAIMKPRLIEEKMLILLRQGKISKWFSGWGQEGISVGAALAMHREEYILPMHRNLGIFTTRGIPLSRLFAQFQGKMSGFTKGRDRSFHFGTQEYNIVGMISHLGPQLGIADGIALANKLKKNEQATIVFSGDGGASEGDFHEALNVAGDFPRRATSSSAANSSSTKGSAMAWTRSRSTATTSSK
jgi:2-oxoisovalerate dehydrogenase E1 component